MSDKGSSNEQLEAIKRHASELIEDMRMRKLLLPAVVLLAAIVAAIVVLPKKGEPVTAPVAATPPPAQTAPVKQTEPIEISLIKPSSVGDGPELTSSSNPFLGTGDYTCSTISNGEPKVLSCEISGLKVRVVCPPDAADPPCGKGQSGASGEAGASGESGGSSGSTGGGETTPKKTPVKTYEYRVSVLFDNKSIKNLRPGDKIPSDSQPYVTFRGVNDSATRAVFRAASGSTVTGVTVDKTGLEFVLSKDKSATITTLTGETHTLKLTGIKKVKL